MSAGVWDRVRALLRREKRDIAEALADATARADEVLDRRERELAASPEERLAMEQERAAAQDDEFEALRRKIEGGQG
jgi:hypothetical protein